MPFTRPTLNQVKDRVSGDINTRLPGSDATLRRSFLGIFARVFSGIMHILFGYLDYLAKQLMPDTAESFWLDRHASIWLKVGRKAASAAVGQVTFTGVETTVIPAGTLLQRSDAVEFTTDADVTITAGSAVASIVAIAPGANSNTGVSTTLALTSPIAGIDAGVTVNAPGITGGTEQENDESLRSRVLKRIQSPPNGGSIYDYELWSLEVPGITRAWIVPNQGAAGIVGIYIVSDDAVPIIPDAPKITEVQNYIDAPNRKPVTANVIVQAPTAVVLDFTMSVVPNTQAVQDAVAAELADLLKREAEPGGTILLSHINEAISLADGETDHVLQAPAADVTHAANEMAVLGVITWL